MVDPLTTEENKLMLLTKQQRKAIKRKYDQDPDNARSYREFRSRVVPEFCSGGAVMLPWCNMWLGIETDGYTHS